MLHPDLHGCKDVYFYRFLGYNIYQLFYEKEIIWLSL